MTEHEPSDDPVPGWPPPPVPAPSDSGATPPPEPPPVDPTIPGYGPPPAAYPPGGYAPPTGPPGSPTPPPAAEPTIPGYGPPPAAYPPGGYQQPGPPGAYPPPGAGYGPVGYGPSGYGGYPPQVEHPQGTTILVLGILSLVCCGILGPVAWIMGNKAIKDIDARPGYYSNRGSVQAGRIIGIVASVLLILVVAFYGLMLFVAAAGSTSGY